MMSTPHLLIVDDDRAIRDLLTKFFVQHGYRVSVAADGRAMQQVLAAGRIDLIVLDVMLPGDDGLSLCRRLRADSAIPIIMLTAKGEDTDRIVGLEMGADDYLPKDFNPRELLSRVRAVHDEAQTLRQRSSPRRATCSNFMAGGLCWPDASCSRPQARSCRSDRANMSCCSRWSSARSAS